MKAFKASGSFKMDKRRRQKFRIEIAAEDKDAAVEKVLSTLGSRHRLKRREIEIDELVEIPPEEITDPVVEYLVRGHQ